MNIKRILLPLSFIFIFFPTFAKKNTNKITVNAPDSVYQTTVAPGKNYKVTVKNDAKADIAIKLKIITMPQSASLSVNINNNVETLDWQEGQTYVFKTYDNTGQCSIDLIGATEFEKLNITYSFTELVNDEISDYTDRLNFIRTMFVDQKEKYNNKVASVLFDDLTKYQANIYNWYCILGTSECSSCSNGLLLYFVEMDHSSRSSMGVKDILLKILIDETYFVSDINDILETKYENDESTDWGQDFINYYKDKVITNLEVIEVGK